MKEIQSDQVAGCQLLCNQSLPYSEELVYNQSVITLLNKPFNLL